MTWNQSLFWKTYQLLETNFGADRCAFRTLNLTSPMGDPLSITTSVLALVGVALKVSATAVGMVEKTTGAHEAARDALRNLRRALQNLNKGTSNMQTILGILISDPRDRVVKKLLAL